MERSRGDWKRFIFRLAGATGERWTVGGVKIAKRSKWRRKSVSAIAAKSGRGGGRATDRVHTKAVSNSNSF